MIAILLGLSKIFKKVLRLGYPRADDHAQTKERVSMVDKTKVDSLLLIPQSPLAVACPVVSVGTEHPSGQLLYSAGQLRRT